MGLFLWLNPEFVSEGLTTFGKIYNKLVNRLPLLYDRLDRTKSEGYAWATVAAASPAKSGTGTGDRCEAVFHQFDMAASKEVAAIQSASPEDKYGPAGHDPEGAVSCQRQRFVTGDRPLDYRIDFWNKETAPAATLDVFITDQLDPKLDWSTFKFTEIGFLAWHVELEPCQFFDINVDNVQIDLSAYYPGAPIVDLVVNAVGSFDPHTGEIWWEFHALDPITLLPPEEPLAGFLPPITDTGWEIGWVDYSVSPLPDLPTGTVISNQAFVKFDVDVFKPAPPNPDSEIPGCGPWINTIDSGAPTSQVQALPAQSCSGIQVCWTGEDDPNGSGVQGYDIYVSIDGGPPELWLSNTTDTCVTFDGAYGHTYSFYSVARDNVGNVEQPPALPDATVTVVDDQAPTLTVPFDVTVFSPDGLPMSVAIGAAKANDNCALASLTNNAPVPAVFPPGETTVTWTATDEAGNTTTDQQIVRVTTEPRICFHLAGNRWHMITIPCHPEYTAPDAIFLDAAGDPIPISGNLHRYDHDQQRYATYYDHAPGDFGDVKPGDGYWLWLFEDTTICYQATCAGIAQTLDFLTAGWYMMGSPQPKDTHLDGTGWYRGLNGPHPFSTVADVALQDPLVGYSGSLGRYTYTGVKATDEDDHLRAFRGYWMYAFEPDLSVEIPAP